MRCEVCGRILSVDSRFCDFCGTKLPDEPAIQKENGESGSVLNTKLLVYSILISLGATLLISLLITKSGIPLFIGGLFLPFFFIKKKKI